MTLRFAEGARLGRVDDDLSVDLTTVVGNLVDNALDAVASSAGTSRTSPARRVRTTRWVEVDVREDGPDVVVVVRDSGPGVEAGLQQRVFERGFTTKAPDAETTRGFGLALTGLVCRRRGGDVSVHNDGGAVFTARLPARRGDGVIRVLVVDDDFMVARIHRGFVESVPGFTVVDVSSTGSQAVAAVRATRPDLVLLDIHLPDVNGLALLPRLREAHPDLGRHRHQCRP